MLFLVLGRQVKGCCHVQHAVFGVGQTGEGGVVMYNMLFLVLGRQVKGVLSCTTCCFWCWTDR